MKTFHPSMLETGEDHIFSSLPGHGELRFDIADRTTKGIIRLRKSLVRRLSAVVRTDGETNNEDADEAFMACAKDVLMACLSADMSEDNCYQLIAASGGPRSDLIRKLATRFGVSDIMAAVNDQEEQEELPT